MAPSYNYTDESVLKPNSSIPESISRPLYPQNSIMGESDSIPSLGQLIMQPPSLIPPSPLSNMQNVANLLTGKLTGSLRRMLLSLFSGNSLHEYITNGEGGKAELHTGGRSISLVDEFSQIADRHHITVS